MRSKNKKKKKSFHSQDISNLPVSQDKDEWTKVFAVLLKRMENITRPKRGSHEIRTKCENFSSFPQCCGLREINALLKQTLSRLNLGIAWLVWWYYLKMKSNGISECAAKRTQESCLEDNPAREIYIGFPRPRFNISSPFSRNFFPAIFSRLFDSKKLMESCLW